MSNADKMMMCFRLEKEHAKALKLACVEKDIPMQKMMEILVLDFLNKKG